MINPYIQSPEGRQPRPAMIEDEAYAQPRGRVLAAVQPRTPVGLWLGKLLIRMGEKLAKQEKYLKTTGQHA